MVAVERSGLELQAQFASAAPRTLQLRARRLAGDFRISVPILGTRGIAEIVGMELLHHVHGRRRHARGNPFQHRICATLDVIAPSVTKASWISPFSRRALF